MNNFISGPVSYHKYEGNNMVILLFGDIHEEKNECDTKKQYLYNKDVTSFIDNIDETDVNQYVVNQGNDNYINFYEWLLNQIKYFRINDQYYLDIFLEHYSMSNVQDLVVLETGAISHIEKEMYYLKGSMFENVYMLENLNCNYNELCNKTRVHYIDSRVLTRDYRIDKYLFQNAPDTFDLNKIFTDVKNAMSPTQYLFLSVDHIVEYVINFILNKVPQTAKDWLQTSFFRNNYNNVVKDFLIEIWTEQITNYFEISISGNNLTNNLQKLNDDIIQGKMNDGIDTFEQFYNVYSKFSYLLSYLDSLIMDLTLLGELFTNYDYNPPNEKVRYAIIYTGYEHTKSYRKFLSKHGFTLIEENINQNNDLCLNIGNTYFKF